MIAALRALRDAMRVAGVPYDRSGYYNIALTTSGIRALMADPEFSLWVRPEGELGYFHFVEGFRIGDLNILHA